MGAVLAAMAWRRPCRTLLRGCSSATGGRRPTGWPPGCMTGLVAHFGEARVFLDIDWIKPGVDFMQVITEAIARSRVLLVIIGPQWLAAEGDGCRRLDRPDDPVRVELETAFRRGLRVIPLLLDGASHAPGRGPPRRPGGAGPAQRPAGGLPELPQRRRPPGRGSRRRAGHRLDSRVADGRDCGGAWPRTSPDKERRPDGAGGYRRDEEQRARLLTRLSRTYTEYLDQSIEHDAIVKLQLELDWLPGRTFRPQDRLLPVPQRQAERLPAGTSLLQAFDRAGGLDGDGLLVLGEPGAGKTTLLFELARRLAERAHADPRHPLPVYLPLSSWATRRPPPGRVAGRAARTSCTRSPARWADEAIDCRRSPGAWLQRSRCMRPVRRPWLPYRRWPPQRTCWTSVLRIRCQPDGAVMTVPDELMAIWATSTSPNWDPAGVSQVQACGAGAIGARAQGPQRDGGRCARHRARCRHDQCPRHDQTDRGSCHAQ